MARITIEDVATSAGVSVTTVSHVFSGHRPVKAETRRHVEEVARALGYRPSAVAKSLRVQRTDTVMIVIPDITNPFYPGFSRGVQDVLLAQGYHSLLCNTDGVESEERTFLDAALTRRVDGVVFGGQAVPVDELAMLSDSGIAVVALAESPADSMIDGVRFDDRLVALEATAYLLARDAGPVAHIAGPSRTPVGRAREEGFADAYSAAGQAVPEGYVVTTDFTQQGGVEGARILLSLPNPPRAILCSNDLMALGVIRVARERGLRVPEDLAVMGVDDIAFAELANPALSTVRLRVDALGRACGELLLERLSGRWSGAARNMVLPHELVLRESA